MIRRQKGLSFRLYMHYYGMGLVFQNKLLKMRVEFSEERSFSKSGKNTQLRLIWSRTPLPVPMDKWSPKIWSPWTNGPQPIWSPWTNSPHQIWSPWTNGPKFFYPPGQMVPNQFGPHISKSSQLVPLDKQNILGTICPGGPYVFGTKCVTANTQDENKLEI